MSLQDRKITDWTQPVSSLADRPQMAASALKAAFDSNTNQIKPALNGVIDDLIGTGGAGNIGVQTIAGVTGTTVQAMLAALKALIDLCDTTEDSDEKFALKADKTTTDKLVKTITFDADTGVFTIKTDDGTTSTIDTLLEKVPINCYLDGQEFVLVLDDGTEQRVDLSAFLTTTEFTDSDTIDFGVSGSTVTASVKNGSITLQMLESTVMSTLQGYMSAAQTAASNAETSETNAGTYAGQAETAKTTAQTAASEADAHATKSESWAVGGTDTRNGEDTNNSRYYAQQASASATIAHGHADDAMEYAERAEQAAEDAEAIVGGDFIPISQKGVPNGIATLDGSGKIPNTQIPSLSYIPANQKGAASGVAELDSTGKVPTNQLPSFDYIPTSQKGAASGVASLDSSGKLEESQKPDYTAAEVGAVPTTRKVNGKALSADVTLTGDNIKTSTTDATSLSSQLSKKAMSSFGELTASDLLVWSQQQSVGGSFFINPAVTTSGIPDIPDKYFIGSLEIGKTVDRRLILTNNNLCTFVNKSLLRAGESQMSWTGWKEVPTATPPQEYSLPLAEGITALQPCTYYKNQFGEVTVGGSVAGTISQDTVIGTLPVGFRPSKFVERPATIGVGATRYPGTVIINPYGVISITTPASEMSAVFEASFLAAQ